MARKHPRQEGAGLAGKGSYDYAAASLLAGQHSVRQATLEMVLSCEFQERFIRGQGDRSAAILLNRVILGRQLDDALADLEAERFQNMGFRGYAQELALSNENWNALGEGGIAGNG